MFKIYYILTCFIKKITNYIYNVCPLKFTVQAQWSGCFARKKTLSPVYELIINFP